MGTPVTQQPHVEKLGESSPNPEYDPKLVYFLEKDGKKLDVLGKHVPAYTKDGWTVTEREPKPQKKPKNPPKQTKQEERQEPETPKPEELTCQTCEEKDKALREKDATIERLENQLSEKEKSPLRQIFASKKEGSTNNEETLANQQ